MAAQDADSTLSLLRKLTPLFPPSFTPFQTPLPGPSKITLAGHSNHTSASSAGKPPLLLLHGFPQTHAIWHRVLPGLADKYTIVLPDLRGYGCSSKPPGSEEDDHAAYSKAAMAGDVVDLMREFGFESFFVCGHDRGGRVAHKLAVDFPERVKRVMVLDICPTLAMYEGTDRQFGTWYWHWFFLIQPAPFPEDSVLGCPEAWVKKALDDELFHPVAMQSYSAQFWDRDTVHGMCEDYRAAATIDLEHQRNDIEQGRKIQCPLRVLWGAQGVIQIKFKAIEEWQKVCSGPVDGKAVDSGHYVPEEAPDELLESMLEFFPRGETALL